MFGYEPVYGKSGQRNVCACVHADNPQLRFMSTCRIRNNHFKCKGKNSGTKHIYIYTHTLMCIVGPSGLLQECQKGLPR